MTAKSTKEISQNPVILRCHRIMEAFAKSDDERDFYLDRVEGFLMYADLDKSAEEIDAFTKELAAETSRYVLIPKLTFYEVKKLMEGFVNEKVYDIDTKEKLLDIIQSKEARENFLEFIYDHHSEMEKWQQYYQERFRVRIIEWLRSHMFDFVFEEDIALTKSIVERIKINMFTPKVSKDIAQARKILAAKATTYYSNEALNPRPKRGRPPKQIAKVETEPQFSQDIYVAVPKHVKPFLFTPDYHSASMVFTFSGKFASEADLLAFRRQQIQNTTEFTSVGQKLSALRTLSSQIRHDLHEQIDTTPSLALMKEAAVESSTHQEKPTKSSSKKSAPRTGRVQEATASKKPKSQKAAAVPAKPAKSAVMMPKKSAAKKAKSTPTIPAKEKKKSANTTAPAKPQKPKSQKRARLRPLVRKGASKKKA